jgi:hypothetical protein
MRQKVREHRDAGGVTALALVAVIVYSLWGATLLHSAQAHDAAAQEQKTLAVK